MIRQICPNHADHISYYKQKYLDEMFENEAVIAQPKYDGERMLLHVNLQHVACTSRRISKKTNEYTRNEDRLPYLKALCEKNPCLDDTVLDCECYAKTWSEAASVLHSLPERAAELQKTIQIKYAVFDCLFFKGNDLRNKPYYVRLNYAKQAVDMLADTSLHFIEFFDDKHQLSTYENAALIESNNDWLADRDAAINMGFEGTVIKSLNKTYYEKAASLKCKKFETVDVVVYDYIQGNGKYQHTVGALKFGYYDEHKGIVPIGQVNCSTDAERDMWRDEWKELNGSVIEVKCQEVTNRSLRHPVYIRLRKDKSATECTKNTIFKEDV